MTMLPFLRRPPAYVDRPLEASDASACATVHNESFVRGWSAAEFENLIIASSSRGDGRFSAADSSILAFVLSRIAADEAEILTIATTRQARRKGFATDLLAAHCQTIARAGARKLLLEVGEDNQAALALYRKFGFQHVGDRPAYYRRANGQSALAKILELRL